MCTPNENLDAMLLNITVTSAPLMVVPVHEGEPDSPERKTVYVLVTPGPGDTVIPVGVMCTPTTMQALYDTLPAGKENIPFYVVPGNEADAERMLRELDVSHETVIDIGDLTPATEDAPEWMRQLVNFDSDKLDTEDDW